MLSDQSSIGFRVGHWHMQTINTTYQLHIEKWQNKNRLYTGYTGYTGDWVFKKYSLNLLKKEVVVSKMKIYLEEY